MGNDKAIFIKYQYKKKYIYKLEAFAFEYPSIMLDAQVCTENKGFDPLFLQLWDS